MATPTDNQPVYGHVISDQESYFFLFPSSDGATNECRKWTRSGQEKCDMGHERKEVWICAAVPGWWGPYDNHEKKICNEENLKSPQECKKKDSGGQCKGLCPRIFKGLGKG